MNQLPVPTPAQQAYWKDRWNRCLTESFLKQSQNHTPDQWERFYDQVSEIWSDMAGVTEDAATAIVTRLLQERLIRKGRTVLDIGCGPGTLSLALARRQIPVTALDQSEGMIRVLTEKLARGTALPVRTRTCDWRVLPGRVSHNTAIAAFFPQACSPDGVHLMETLATDTCVLIMGDGRETFPLRRQIWDRVMPAPCPDSGFHSVCAAGYLSAAGRAPRMVRLSLPASLTADAAVIRTYFTAYFTLIGVPADKTRAALQDAVAPFMDRGRVCLQGCSHLVIAGWSSPRNPESSSS